MLRSRKNSKAKEERKRKESIVTPPKKRRESASALAPHVIALQANLQAKTMQNNRAMHSMSNLKLKDTSGKKNLASQKYFSLEETWWRGIIRSLECPMN